MFVNLEITLRPVIAFGMQPYSLRSFRSARLENEKASIPQKEKSALLSPSGYSQAERPSFGPASPQWGHKSQAATLEDSWRVGKPALQKFRLKEK
jgi:hypothetical protein